MALATSRVTVGTTAVRLSSEPADSRADSALALTAPAAAILYIGNADVTAATGFPVPAGGGISLDLQNGERLYGVLASGSGVVSVLEGGI